MMNIRLEKAMPEQLKAKPAVKELGFGIHFTDHMFTMAYSNKQWHDAKISPYASFVLDPAAMVLHYGQAIFEGLKAYRSENDRICLFRPLDNLKRMNYTADRMCMPQIPVEDVLEGLKTLLRVDRDWIPGANGATVYIRPTMVATEAALGVRPAAEYLFFIIMSPVGAYYPEGFNPVKIFVEDNYVRAVRGGVGHVKTSGNYAASIKAAVEAKKQGYTQVLWLDALERKYVEEVGTSNIFFVIDNELITPPLTGSILPGITRDSAMELARSWGVRVSEQRVSIDDVLGAIENGRLQEIFATGTAAVISPVGGLHYKGKDYLINNGKTGELALRLFDEIQGIQYGRIPAPFDWVVDV